MHSILSSLLLLLGGSAVALPHSVEHRESSKDAPTVQTYPVLHYKGAVVGDIAASRHKNVVVGSVDGNNTVFYGILKLDTTSGIHPNLVSLESFVPYIKTIDCSKSEIKLAFTTKDAYDVASSWPESFSLVTATEKYCGNGHERIFYTTKPQFHPATSSVTLKVKATSRHVVSPGYTIEFGTHAIDGGEDSRISSIASSIRDHFSSSIAKRQQYGYETPPSAVGQILSPWFAGWNTTNNPYGITGDSGSPTFTMTCASGPCGPTYAIGGISGNIGTDSEGNWHSFDTYLSLVNSSVSSLYMATMSGGSNLSVVNRQLGATNSLYSYIISEVGTISAQYALTQTLTVKSDAYFTSTGFGLGNNILGNSGYVVSENSASGYWSTAGSLDYMACNTNEFPWTPRTTYIRSLGNVAYVEQNLGPKITTFFTPYKCACSGFGCLVEKCPTTMEWSQSIQLLGGSFSQNFTRSAPGTVVSNPGHGQSTCTLKDSNDGLTRISDLHDNQFNVVASSPGNANIPLPDKECGGTPVTDYYSCAIPYYTSA